MTRPKAVPILKCRDLKKSVAFYTGVLDFQLADQDSDLSPVVSLIKDELELQLSVLEGDSVFGTAVMILTPNVDQLFQSFRARGLDPSSKHDSPVHQGPVNQTWGTREFYVDDPDGNTLRFVQRKK